jgi:hypothetical protein
MERRLERLKKLAQSQEPYEHALAQVSTDGHIFEAKDKGGGLFPFILEDNAYRISLARNRAKSLPMAYAKISSDYLAHVTPHDAELRLGALLRAWGTLMDVAAVSRIDLFLDFVSGFDMEGWNRQSWVTRATAVDAHARDSSFSGWSIGLGGPVAGRLYDKTLEIQVKRNHEYLPDLWRGQGWDGKAKVWRLEFQFRREMLAQNGLRSFQDVMDNLNGLWSYATTEWLRLCQPNTEDKTRSRWPIHPLWQCLSAIDWGTPGGPLSRQFSLDRRPTEGSIYGRALSSLVCFMAYQGITDYYEAEEVFLRRMRSHHERLCHEFIGVPFEQYVEEKVRAKARVYNTILNATVDATDETASYQPDDYEQASNGFNPYGEEE